MAGNQDDVIELHPHFRRIEVEREVPDWLKDGAESREISDIVNHPESRFVIGRNSNYLARVLLKDTTYIIAYPKFRQMSIGLQPETDAGTSLPICCQNRDLIIHTALRFDGDVVWIYTGRDAPDVLSEVVAYTQVKGSSEQREEFQFRTHPMLLFFRELGFEPWNGEGWDALRDGRIDLSQHRQRGLFDFVPYSEFSRKIDMLRDFCRVNDYFGFLPPDVREHPEPDYRRAAVYQETK